jgi:hypothetical protein
MSGDFSIASLLERAIDDLLDRGVDVHARPEGASCITGRTCPARDQPQCKRRSRRHPRLNLLHQCALFQMSWRMIWKACSGSFQKDRV